MKRPENWPFSSWLDLDDVISASGGETVDLAEMLRSIVSLQQDYLAFIDSFLHGKKVFKRPTFWNRIIYGLTADMYFGARTAETYQPSGYAIAIYPGSWLQLFMCFSRLLADPELSLSLPLLTPNGVTDAFKKDYESPSDGLRTDSKVRQLCALATRFLFFHEFAHITFCHVDYKLLSPQLQMVSTLESQCMEHLADLHACSLAFQFPVLIGLQEANEGDAVTKENLIREQFWKQGFAVGTVTLLLETLNSLADTHHPPADKRALFLRVGAVGSPADPVGFGRREALTALDNGYKSALDAWDKRGWSRNHSSLEWNALEYAGVIKGVEEKVAASGARDLSIRKGRRDTDD